MSLKGLKKTNAKIATPKIMLQKWPDKETTIFVTTKHLKQSFKSTVTFTTSSTPIVAIRNSICQLLPPFNADHLLGLEA
jgi:hypothetical protein